MYHDGLNTEKIRRVKSRVDGRILFLIGVGLTEFV